VASDPPAQGRPRGHRDRLKDALPLRHALTLGALQGVAEALPVSSSAHLALLPRLAGWPYVELDPDVRKSFEVALHAGSAAALAMSVGRDLRELPAADLAVLALTAGPPAVAGLVLERPIEERLGGPRAVAVAQLSAAGAMWLADRTPQRRTRPDVGDALAVGLAQALALVPGVSRAGAALTAARLRGLRRTAAATLSLRAALPVTVGAAALKALRARGAMPAALVPGFAAGAVAAFATGLAASRLAARLAGRRTVAALALYRVGLGLAALALRWPAAPSGGREPSLLQWRTAGGPNEDPRPPPSHPPSHPPLRR
jgi:undecaprenyl-diphosphatase